MLKLKSKLPIPKPTPSAEESRVAAPFAVVLSACGERAAAERAAAETDATPEVMSLPEYLARYGIDSLSSLGEFRSPTTGEYHSIHALVVDVIVRSESASAVTRGKARELWALACEAFERPRGWRESGKNPENVA